MDSNRSISIVIIIIVVVTIICIIVVNRSLKSEDVYT